MITRRTIYLLLPILLTTVIVLVGLATIANAAECAQGFCPLADIEGTKLQGLYGSSGEGDLSKFISRIFTFAITAGALMAVLRLTYAGYLYMVTDLWTTKGKAVEIIQTTVLGLFLLLAVYLILNQINPQILSLRILFTSTNNAAPSEGPAKPEPKPAGSQYSTYAITVTPQVSTGPNTFEPLNCLVTQGPGWLAVDEQYCGGDLPNGYSCCAFDPNYAPGDLPKVEGVPDEERFYDSETEIPPGSWCYQPSAGAYNCTATQSECLYSAGESDSVTNGCKPYPDN